MINLLEYPTKKLNKLLPVGGHPVLCTAGEREGETLEINDNSVSSQVVNLKSLHGNINHPNP